MARKIRPESAEDRARRKGVRFVRKLRKFFADIGDKQNPNYNGVQVVTLPHSGTYFIQRVNGKVVGGALGSNGERRMIAGGAEVGSPVSAAEVYEAMNARGLKPSQKLTPQGRAAQEAHGA